MVLARYRLAAALLAALITTACADVTVVRTHDPSELATFASTIVGRSDAVSETGESAPLALAKRLNNAEKRWEVGSIAGPLETQWGNIAAVSSARSGHVYVLDSFMNDIRIFDPDGGFVRRLGWMAEGNVSWRNLSALDIQRDSILVVAGAFGVRFLKLTPALDVLLEVGTGSVTKSQLCSLHDDAYLRIADPDAVETVLRIASESGDTSKFGVGYDRGAPAVRAMLSEGSIACVEGSDAVITAFKNLPIVRGYTSDGVLRWSSALGSFASAGVEEVIIDGLSGVRHNVAALRDMVVGVSELPPHSVLLQVLRGETDGSEGTLLRQSTEAALDSYIVSSDDGSGVFIGSDLPLVLHANENTFWAVEIDSLYSYQKLVAYVY